MKPRRLLLTCLFSFLLVMGLGSQAVAQTITLEATTESGAVPTGFVAGQNLQLYIQVDDAAGIAGAAFTLFYPSDMLTAPVTDVDGVPQVTGEIDSFFPFMYVNPLDAGDTTDTWRTNSAETGQIYFSGAAIDTSDGGAQYGTTGTKDLFVVTFTVKEGVALGNIADAFTLEQTELFNPAAGYGIDVGGDGGFDDGVDSTGLVPVLVGALSTADTTGAVDGFGGDLSDDFPILLDESGLINGLIASLDLNIVDGYAITGTASYSGNQAGNLKVAAFDVADTEYTTPIGGQQYSWPAGTTSQAFTVKVPNGSYYLAAIIDDGDDLNEDFEPVGDYTTTQIDIIDNDDDTTTRDFSLNDPLDGVTGEPIYFENWKTNNGYTNIGASTDDYDRDGYSNIQELINGTDPTSQDAAGGTGYDAGTDIRVQTPHFTVANTSPNSIVFYGDNFTIEGEGAAVGDEIGVYDPDGVLCGAFRVENPAGIGIYAVTVYGDDSTSGATDEGAVANDVLTFKVWDDSSGSEIAVTTAMFTPAVVYSSPASVNPPQWTANNDTWGLNMAVVSSETIPLQAGWNLISFTVNNFYYDSVSEPTVAKLTNATAVQVTSIADVLASIDGQYEVVRSFDATGAHTYNPAVPAFLNDLHYLAAGYGYWIKMTEAADLVLSGSRAVATDTLALNSGWNLIGSWGPAVQYDSAAAPTVDFPAGVTMTKVTSIADVFNAIDGFYDVVRSFDAAGAHTYNPAVPAFLNDLHYVGPGYGYWIKTTEAQTFNY